MDKLNYALIGCGRISPNHIESAIKNDLNIVALCDLEENKMNQIIERFNFPNSVKTYVDYIEMLENENIDLVAICTESGKHAPIALQCLEKGVHLIIEKPIALSLQDADAIIKKAEEKQLKVTVCHQNRFNKSVQKLREAVNQNRFGKLLYGTCHVRWNRNDDYYKQDSWRGTWEYDGGALMNQCIHNIDLLRWMMGEVVEVVGMTDNLKHDYIEAEDFGVALVRFANGSYGVIEGTTNVYPQNLEETLYIFGEKGTAKLGGKSVNRIDEWFFADELDNPEQVKANFVENPPNIYGFGHSLLYQDMIDAIIQNRQPYVTAVDGKLALELILAIYQSSYEKRSVQLPLPDVSSKDFSEMFLHSREVIL